MRLWITLALFVAATFLKESAATRRPLRLYVKSSCRGDLIGADTDRRDIVNAETDAVAMGDLTDTYGNSNVEADSYGAKGSLSHRARGFGRGRTGARSRGKIDSSNGFRTQTLGSEASADAFGSLSSFSETSGNAVSYNGIGHAGSSSVASGSGYGSSRARTSASAGQSYRYKRSVDVDAGTDAAGLGDFTKTFGESDVDAGPYVASARAAHGARGRGRGLTGAKSSGDVEALDFFGYQSAGSDARADAFGNLKSFSTSNGDSELFNGYSRSGASSKAGSLGFGKSRSRTRASATAGSRKKRHVRYPYDARASCGYGNCGGGSVDAETDARGIGDYTDSYGNSNVAADNYGTRGLVSHGARGMGYGYTAARSRGRIYGRGRYGGSSIGSDAQAEAYGNMGSYSETRGNAETCYGCGSSGSSSTAGSRGYGVSRSSSTASAGGSRRRYRRHANRPLCILGLCYKSVDARTGGSALGDFTESFGDSSISAQPGILQGLAIHKSIGRGRGRTGAASKSQIESQTQYGYGSVGSASKADAFGEHSLSMTSSKTRKLNGASFSESQAKGSASGRGRSAARSESVATRY